MNSVFFAAALALSVDLALAQTPTVFDFTDPAQEEAETLLPANNELAFEEDPVDLEDEYGPQPVIYQSIRQSDEKYGLAGRYGVIRSADKDDLDHVVVFEWRVYNGLAAQDGNIFLMYA